MLSITGKLIEKKTFNGTNLIQIQVQHPNGIYLVELLNEKNKKAIIRVIKE